MVRRCVVRAEQIFRAYRQLLPPQREHRTSLRLVIFGSTDEYQRHVREAGLQIAGPAWFSASQNQVLAGGELNTFSRRLRQTQAQNEEVRRQYKALKSSFADRLAGLIQEMKQRGFSAAQIEQEVKLRSAAWQREYDEAMKRLELAQVQNEAAFAKMTDQMFAQLYHEAFHAYVKNYVCVAGGFHDAPLAERGAGTDLRGRPNGSGQPANRRAGPKTIGAIARRPARRDSL